MNTERLPSALTSLHLIRRQIGARLPVFFLDFDGTLAPIVSRPELAALTETTRSLLASLAQEWLVCIMSGRDLAELRSLVDVPSLYYGANHGRHIVGPAGSSIRHEVGGAARPDLRAAAEELTRRLAGIEGTIVESKDLSLSLHYRLTPAAAHEQVADIVGVVAQHFPALRLEAGKLVHELKPRDNWNKGKALIWLLTRLQLSTAEVCPICLGDDLTDEDMFRAAAETQMPGISILVGETTRPTLAQYKLNDVDETARFLRTFAADPRESARPKED